MKYDPPASFHEAMDLEAAFMGVSSEASELMRFAAWGCAVNRVNPADVEMLMAFMGKFVEDNYVWKGTRDFDTDE